MMRTILKRRLQQFWLLLKRSAVKYRKDDPVRLAGTTAYFTVFAMAPILIIIISVAGILLGEEQIQDKAFNELAKLIGDQGSRMFRNYVMNYQDTQKGITGTIVGFVILIFTSTTFFVVMQRSLNYIWRVRAKPARSLLKSLKDRILSFGLVLSLGFILIVSLMMDAFLAFLKDFTRDSLPELTSWILKGGNFLFSFGILMVIFAMIFRILPDAKIKWKVTWTGAFITTVLIVAGKSLISILLGRSNIGVMYGAAGSLLIALLWVFYSSIIFFFGAEITQQYAEMYAHRIEPKKYAVKIEINEIGQQEDV